MEGGDGINLSNWGGGGGGGMCDTVFPSIYKFCMTNAGERKTPFLGGHGNGSFPPRGEYGGMSSSLYSFEYPRGQQYLNLRDEYKPPYFNIMPPHQYGGISPDTTPAPPHHTAQFLHQRESPDEERIIRAVEPPTGGEDNNDPVKKRSTAKFDKAPKMKKPKKIANGTTKEGGSGSAQRAKSAKKITEVVINGIDMDISSIPIPVCSCTGAPQQCYRWGYGGWQSACCTTGMSMYPLPMSTKRRGARIAGRKMSLGAFKKVLEKLAAEGYNFSNPIDLRTHWAKHGTNKFVTIR